MGDKDMYDERDVNISGTVENDDETALEDAMTAVTLPSSEYRTISSLDTTLSDQSARVHSNSHHTQVRRSTDNREENLLLESEENPRRQQHCTFSDSLVRIPQLSRQTSSRSQRDEPSESIVQPLEDISLLSSTTSTPQQESCGCHFDDPSHGRLENDAQLRRSGLVDGEKVQGK